MFVPRAPNTFIRPATQRNSQSVPNSVPDSDEPFGAVIELAAAAELRTPEMSGAARIRAIVRRALTGSRDSRQADAFNARQSTLRSHLQHLQHHLRRALSPPKAYRFRLANTIHRHPLMTVLLCCGVVWWVSTEEHTVREETLRQRITELEGKLAVQQDESRHALPRLSPLPSASVTASATESPSLKNGASPEETSISEAAHLSEDPSAAIVPRHLIFDGTERADPFLGPSNAPFLVMVMTDLQCTRCRQFYNEVLLPLQRDLIKAGDTRILLRNLPLPSNSHAVEAARVALCAGEQSRYFEALDALFAHPNELQSGKFAPIVRDIRVPHPERLQHCTQTDRYRAEIDRDREFALAFGATGVPTTFVGLRNEDGSYSGSLIRGAQPLPVFNQVLGELRKSHQRAK